MTIQFTPLCFNLINHDLMYNLLSSITYTKWQGIVTECLHTILIQKIVINIH